MHQVMIVVVFRVLIHCSIGMRVEHNGWFIFYSFERFGFGPITMDDSIYVMF